MRKAQFHDLELSSLMLGTVQFGMTYGIANRIGQPSYQDARDILACAYEGGVNCLDTAAEYGTSEEVIGKALAELGIADEIMVVTKIWKKMDACDSASAADAVIEQSVLRSLERLKLDVLPICLLHAEEHFRYIESLLRLKDKGLVRHVGVSVMTPKATSAIIASGLAEAVQIPTNVLDHRYTRSGICDRAKDAGVALFVRSVYLKGLLLMPEEDIPYQVAEVIPYRRKVEALANEAGMGLGELAMRYVLGLPGLTCALAGVESVPQMRENVALVSKGPLDAALMAAISDAMPILPDKILKPNKWLEAGVGEAPLSKEGGGRKC